MPTLVLPPRYTPDSIALSGAAGAAGWEVERLASWRVPDWLVGRDVVLYGEPLFAAVVAEPLGVALLEPPFGWLPSLSLQYRQREVRHATLSEARLVREPAFIKPADDKCFIAKVYEDGEQLPNEDVLPGITPVLIAEPVTWEVEFRSFVLDRAVLTISPYWRAGQLAQTPEGEWADARTGEALEFASRVVADRAFDLPPAVALDVGIIQGRGWAVIEANAAWGSGIYGCDPAQVLKAVRRSCIGRHDLTQTDRRWVVDHTAA